MSRARLKRTRSAVEDSGDENHTNENITEGRDAAHLVDHTFTVDVDSLTASSLTQTGPMFRPPVLQFDRGGTAWKSASRGVALFRVDAALLAPIDDFLSVSVTGTTKKKASDRRIPFGILKSPPEIPIPVIQAVKRVFDIYFLRDRNQREVDIEEIPDRATATSNALEHVFVISEFLQRTYGLSVDVVTPIIQWWFRSYCLVFKGSGGRVMLRRRVLKGGRGFIVQARTALKQQECLYELTGACSNDSFEDSLVESPQFPYTISSLIKQEAADTEDSWFDGRSRLLAGPMRWVQHDCGRGNVVWRRIADTGGYVLYTMRDIEQGEELFVRRRGTEYWLGSVDDPCPCASCIAGAGSNSLPLTRPIEDPSSSTRQPTMDEAGWDRQQSKETGELPEREAKRRRLNGEEEEEEKDTPTILDDRT
ncbi:hypothetical protein PQX77_003757 [Marasmius sp. AFHP31]|nr:hypothetical protein PQX77_003757 [Marasmius sp. AFHP31]